MKTVKSFSLELFHSLRHILTIPLIAIILSFIGWVNYEKIQSIQDTQSRLQTNNQLQQAVQRLHADYLRANPQELEKNLHKANLLLLQNFTDLTQWAQAIQTRGKTWNLQTQYRITDTKRIPSPLKGVKLVPLEILITSKGTQSAYRPYLQLLKFVTESGPRVDIHQVTIMGDGLKANHLKIELSVWMKTIESVKL